MGGYIGDSGPQAQWLVEKVHDWTGGIRGLLVVAHKHLKVAYMSLQKSLQQELAFVQRATQLLGEEFRPAEKSLR